MSFNKKERKALIPNLLGKKERKKVRKKERYHRRREWLIALEERLHHT